MSEFSRDDCFFRRWTHTKRFTVGIILLKPLNMADSRSTLIFYEFFNFEFAKTNSWENLPKVSSFFQKWRITGPRNTGCFPVAGFSKRLFLYNVYHVTDIKCGINCKNRCFKVLKYKISQRLGFAFQCMQMQNNVLQLLSQFLSNFQDSTVLWQA